MSFPVLSLLGRPMESVFDSFASVGFGQRTTLEFMLDRLYLKAPDFGIGLVGSIAGRVESIILFAVERDDYRPFFGDLPDGLFAGEARGAVRDRLGEPNLAGETHVPGIGRIVPQIDRWDRPAYWLHVTYDEAGVSIVTLMTPETASSPSAVAR